MKFLSWVNKHRILSSFTIAFFLIGFSFGFKVKESQALLGFGGNIYYVGYCTCSENLFVVVGAPSPGVYVYNAESTIVDMWYMIFYEGPWVLGTYFPTIYPVSACWEYVGVSCAPVPTSGVILEVGTSL